ncbi:hypothetical protein IMCC12053_1914 [Celeribacter marinus]|uniref:Uncharacterized protein n=1 Tax=Celeribacter marinus TaxID=1397108 RepID=A0A0N7HIQ3_9RHOB|nr:hypothetical protein IMCC12053_1914 [Celeribacter marinus]
MCHPCIIFANHADLPRLSLDRNSHSAHFIRHVSGNPAS